MKEEQENCFINYIKRKFEVIKLENKKFLVKTQEGNYIIIPYQECTEELNSSTTDRTVSICDFIPEEHNKKIQTKEAKVGQSDLEPPLDTNNRLLTHQKPRGMFIDFDDIKKIIDDNEKDGNNESENPFISKDILPPKNPSYDPDPDHEKNFLNKNKYFF